MASTPEHPPGPPKTLGKEAARFMPIEQLCLSPQCGFASSARSGLPMDLV
jgi:hypothetical protein